jgi:hypothetical protein
VSGYDPAAHQRYLELPYTQRAQEEAEFEKYCETHDLDPEDDGSYECYMNFIEDHGGEIGPDPDDEREQQWELEQEGRGRFANDD